MAPEGVEIDLRINAELVTDILCRFVRNEIHRAGFERAVVGLSGGIDSSVVTFLVVQALGPENVLTVTMPYKTSSEATRNDSRVVVEQLGVQTLDVPITDQVPGPGAFAPAAKAGRAELAMRCHPPYSDR